MNKKEEVGGARCLSLSVLPPWMECGQHSCYHVSLRDRLYPQTVSQANPFFRTLLSSNVLSPQQAK